MKKFLLSVLCLAAFPIFAANVTDIQMVKGKCAKQSHIAEGKIGSDLTKQRSRFFCDTAILTFFDNNDEHVMVTFVESKSHTRPHVGFAGIMDDDGQIMDVHNVYIGTENYPVNEGHCKFFFKKKKMDGIACGAPIDQEDRRTVPVVVFDAK